jgi:pimeloyl-ACP methyl ester carboxylesterase
MAVQFQVRGAAVNGQVYRPAGAGVHPTVVLLHGLPGNEQGLDLARTLQRAGWTVITFHYRGSWGSGGEFRLAGGEEDAGALLDLLKDPAQADAWGVDPACIVLVGHSYGGLVAASVAGRRPEVRATALLAPWDPSHDARDLGRLSAADRERAAAEGFNDVEGRLGSVTVASLTDDLMTNGRRLDLAKTAPGLTGRPLLILTATRDSDSDKALTLIPAIRAADARHLTVEEMPTDHSFNDHRIALATAVLTWLAKLPFAPPVAG